MLLRVLGYLLRLIRGMCGMCVVVIVWCGGVENWGDLWSTFVRAVEAGDENF